MRRQVKTPQGPLEYELTRKRVKNLNLRLGPDGLPQVSAPARVAVGEVDRFVLSRAGWIARARARQAAAAAAAAALPPPPDDAGCMAAFGPALQRYAPLFAEAIGGPLQLKLKTLRSMWGVCRPARREITLNRYLALQPPPAIEYVVLHEYLHFLYPDHGPAFHRALDRLMPDNRQRRALLPRQILPPPGAGAAGRENGG